MREHGVLRRILLIYAEAVRRNEGRREIPYQAVYEGAEIVRSFVEDYHEKLEEDLLFPRFRAAQKCVELVKVLLQQHRAGRRLTDRIMQCAADRTAPTLLIDTLRQFTTMYRPHAAREDTVLFPAFNTLVSSRERYTLGEQFEDKENEQFGRGGFGKTVARVAAIEKSIGLYELSQFTPSA